MNDILEWLVTAEDSRQQAKVKHLMRDIIAIVFFAELANATEWIEIYLFAAAHEEPLRKYLELPNGIPSHDTIQRVFAMVSPKYLQEFRSRWNGIMSGGMGEKIKKILSLDGKTQRGNGNEEQKANHIVSAVDKAHGAVETREYWQTDDVAWLQQGKAWAGLASIVMTQNTITRGGDTVTEVRYFISSLPLNVEEAARAIRGHWMVESYHWHLDVTFREDANHTLDKAAAYNLNIIKKMAINTLRLVDVGIARISMKNKRYLISMNFRRYLDTLMAL